MRSDVVLSATIRSASSCRSILSVRQSRASSMAERSRLPRYSSSFDSKREKSAKASAEDPANPAMTSPLFKRRTFAAPCFMTVVPSVTWPSEAIATFPPWRTQTTVVECHFSRSVIAGTLSQSSRPRSPHTQSPSPPVPQSTTCRHPSSGRRGGLRSPLRNLRLRVRAAIDVAQAGGVQVGVLLRGREGGVAEGLLDRAQVGAGGEKVRREGMGQGGGRQLRGGARRAE